MIVAAVYTLMSAWTPMQLDDYLFMDVYHCHSGNSSEFSSEAMAGFIGEIRANDNCRIANIMAPVFLMFEPFRSLFPYITGALCALIIWMICRLSVRPRDISVAKCVLVWTLFIVFLPWRNNIFVTDYALNYIYSSAITLGMVLLMLRSERSGWSVGSLILLSIIAIVAGGWHEGFSFPTVGGLLVYGWLARRHTSWQWWTVTAIYLMSALAFALSPGLIGRAHAQAGGYNFTGYIKMMADLALVVIVLGVQILLFINVKGRRFLSTLYRDSPAMIIFSVAMIVSAVLSMAFHASARTAFFPELCAIVCAMIMITAAYKSISTKYTYLFVAVLLILCCAQSVAALVWQHRFYVEDDRIMEQLLTSEHGSVFYDSTQPEDVPLYTMFFPARIAWTDDFHYYCLKQCMHRDIISVAPTSLADTTLMDEKVGHAYRRGGALWLPDDPAIDAGNNIDFNVRMQDDDTWRMLPGFSNRYIDADGDTLIYIKIYKTDPADIAEVEIVR